jgi:transcriptional regulator with XRE-family HTH domain
MSIGRRVAEARQSKGLSQYALAKQVGVSSAYIQKLERGEIRTPAIEKLQRFAEVLGVSVGSLVESEQEHGQLAEDRNARLWEKFAAHFKAGDPETFAEVVASLPKNDQAMLVRLAKLLDIESKLG